MNELGEQHCQSCGSGALVPDQLQLRCVRCHPTAKHRHRVNTRSMRPGERFERCRCGATRVHPLIGDATPWKVES